MQKSMEKMIDTIYSGVIAQELEESHPHLVNTSEMNGIEDFKTIKTQELQFELIATVQHLLREVRELRAEVELLRSK